MTIRHFAALCLVGALAACSKPEAAARSATAGAQRHFSGEQSANCRVSRWRHPRPPRGAAGARVGGKVVARLVDVGATVARPGCWRGWKTTMPAWIWPAAAPLAAAEADLKQNEADIKRYCELLAQHFISQAEFDCREAALAAARGNQQAALAAAQLGANQQGYTTLSAERAGW